MKKQLTALFAVLCACVLSSCSAPANENFPKEDEVTSTSFSQDIPEKSSQPSVASSSSTTNVESGIISTTSTESETITSKTDLFDKVYSPYALRVYSPNVNDVIEFVSNCGFKSSVSTENGYKEIKVISGDDYVYFCFAPRSTADSNTFTTVSYYQDSSKSEVSLNNYSTSGDYEYDTLQMHVIGESNKDSRSVTAQRDFLFDEETSSSETSSPNKNTVLYNQNDILIEYKSWNVDKIGNIEVNLYIENNSENDFYVRTENFSAEDFQMVINGTWQVNVGKKLNDSITIYKSEIEKNGLSGITSIEFDFAISSTDYTIKYSTDTISLTLE